MAEVKFWDQRWKLFADIIGTAVRENTVYYHGNNVCNENSSTHISCDVKRLKVFLFLIRLNHIRKWAVAKWKIKIFFKVRIKAIQKLKLILKLCQSLTIILWNLCLYFGKKMLWLLITDKKYVYMYRVSRKSTSVTWRADEATHMHP